MRGGVRGRRSCRSHRGLRFVSHRRAGARLARVAAFAAAAYVSRIYWRAPQTMKQGGSSLMDRRVKERLVGATILVALIVLIVPELLSGPKPRMTAVQPSSSAGPSEAVRNVTVDLTTSKATPAE